MRDESRNDFFASVETRLGNEQVNVSAGEVADEGDGFEQACLLQIGQDGDFATAYLNDVQVHKLIEALQNYLECNPD